MIKSTFAAAAILVALTVPVAHAAPVQTATNDKPVFMNDAELQSIEGAATRKTLHKAHTDQKRKTVSAILKIAKGKK